MAFIIHEFNDKGVQFRKLRAQSFEAALLWAKRDQVDADIIDEASDEIIACVSCGEPVYVEPHYAGRGCASPNCGRCA